MERRKLSLPAWLKPLVAVRVTSHANPASKLDRVRWLTPSLIGSAGGVAGHQKTPGPTAVSVGSRGPEHR